MVTLSLNERIFLYDYKQYESWCGGDINTIQTLTNVCGNLCRGSETYINQAKDFQNYPEVRYAVHLVKDMGYPKEYIIYENFRVSLQMVNQLIKGKGFQAAGAKLIKEVFSSLFLERIDTLCDLNDNRFGQIKKICKGTHVDLCAINHKSREVRFCEIKRYDFGGTTKDKFTVHQQLLMGFVRYAADSLGEKAFQNSQWKVITELIAFVPEKDSSSFTPKKYEIDFSV